MSAAESTPKADVSTPVLDEEDKAFNDQLEVIEQVRDCVLLTPEFSQVCSCDDCVHKIESLKEFEKYLKAKTTLMFEYGAQVQNNEDLCVSICLCAQSMKDLLEFLERKLKKVLSVESGVVSWTLEKCNSIDELKTMDKEISERLRGVGLLGQLTDTFPDDDSDSDSATHVDYKDDIFEKTDSVRFYCKKTKSKDDVYVLLEAIEKFEKDLEMAKAQKLQKQIEEVKKFPIGKLKHEVEELIAKILPRDFHFTMIQKARQVIYNVCYSCIIKRKEFLKRSPLPTQGNEHSSNGLNETLNSLMEEVELFKKQWKNEFAHIFTPYDRSDPKRQLVE